MKDLRKRFQYALLANGYGFYAQWRNDVGYQIGKTLKISVPHRGKSYLHIAGGPQHTMESAIQEMLVQSRGMKIDWSLNHIHTCANEVQTIGLVVQESGCSFVLRFGYPNDSSHWDYVIASTHGNEPFAETLKRTKKRGVGKECVRRCTSEGC